MSADKHHSTHRLIRRIQLLVGFTALCGGLFVYELVSNSNGAVTRYDALIAADQANGDVETALNDLRSHIHSHMNSEVGGGPTGIYPPIQLNGTYERLLAVEEARVADINSNLSGAAQAFCEATGSQGFSGGNRLDCISNYIDQNGATAQTIDPSLYTYDFVSPRWSSDLAGFGLLGVLVGVFTTSLHIFMYLHIRYLVHRGN